MPAAAAEPFNLELPAGARCCYGHRRVDRHREEANPVLRMHREIFDRVRPGIDQRPVPSLECDEGDLVVIGIALDEPQHAGAGDAADVILREVAEQDRLCRGRDRRHVLVYCVCMAQDRIRLAIGRAGEP